MIDARVFWNFTSKCPECAGTVRTIRGKQQPHQCDTSSGGAVNDGPVAIFPTDGADAAPNKSKDQADPTAPAAPPARPLDMPSDAAGADLTASTAIPRLTGPPEQDELASRVMAQVHEMSLALAAEEHIERGME